MNKKILVLLLVLFLVGCNKRVEPEKTVEEEKKEEVKETENEVEQAKIDKVEEVVLDSNKKKYTFTLKDKNIKNSKREICSVSSLKTVCEYIIDKKYGIDYVVTYNNTSLGWKETMTVGNEYAIYDSNEYYKEKAKLIISNDVLDVYQIEKDKTHELYYNAYALVEIDDEDEDDDEEIIEETNVTKDYEYYYKLDEEENEEYEADEDDEINGDKNNPYVYYAYNKGLKEYTKGYTFLYPVFDSDYDYFIASEDVIGVVNVKTKMISTEYSGYTCKMVTDTSSYRCNKSETILVNKYTKKKTLFGLFSLTDYKIILEPVYEGINEISNGNFIVKKDGKVGVVDKTGKTLLNLEYDYIANSEYFGYIAIKNDDLFIYDNDLNNVEIKENTISNLFDSGLKKYNEVEKALFDSDNDSDEKFEEYKELFLSNHDYSWSSGLFMIKYNVSKTYKPVISDFNSIKYSGKKYTGTQILLVDQLSSCGKNPLVYVIVGNKVERINKKEIKVSLSCF